VFKQREPGSAPKPDYLETIIGKDSEFKGTVSSAAGLRIDGKMEGQVLNSGDVIIGDSAEVTADVKGRNVIISGLIRGNIEATGKIEITATGRVEGDLKTNVLIVSEGGKFSGKSDMTSNTRTYVASTEPQAPKV
jgi:cytoskeletal protein CcmA (bactofilin family)